MFQDGVGITEYRIGCSGWSYRSWLGPFYPRKSGNEDMLGLYSKVFDCVEVDSTFYGHPKEDAVRRWKAQTPDGFLFTLKMPKIITHERRLANVSVHLEYFLKSIRILGDKLGPVLVQLPHSFIRTSNEEKLHNFVKELPEDMEFSIEFRDNSWFTEDVFSLLEDASVSLAWSDTPFNEVPERVTDRTLYLRLVGDRNIGEKDFGRIVRDKDSSVTRWAERIRSLENEIDRVFIFSNNHFQGFGPGTANLARRSLGLDEIEWTARMKSRSNNNQSTLPEWE